MTYPLSSDVSSGQPTAAAHYNNLRADALYLGQSSADAVSLAALLVQFQHNVTLTYLATNRLRVTATSSAPVHLVMDGIMLSALSNVDLPIGSTPSGAAMTYYVFAVRSVGSTTFTLDINSSPTDSTGRRNIGSLYWDGSNIVRESIRTAYQDAFNTVLSLQSQLQQVCNGRLTLSSGTPITTSDVYSSGTLYFSPHRGNRVALYVQGFGWKVYPFTEVSLSLASISNVTNYDVFLYDNYGTLTLSLEAWANDSTRSVALVYQDGVYVRSSQEHKRYLGTIRGTGAGTTADSATARFVWNMYNQEQRYILLSEATSHTYTGSTAVRPWNNTANNATQVYFILGFTSPIFAIIRGQFKSSSTSQWTYVQLHLDGLSALINGCLLVGSEYTSPLDLSASTCTMIGSGYHYLQMAEYINSPSITGSFTACTIGGYING